MIESSEKRRPARPPDGSTYILADRDCDHVLGRDGELLDLDEAAANPELVWVFQSEAKARIEQTDQNLANYRDLQILRKRPVAVAAY